MNKYALLTLIFFTTLLLHHEFLFAAPINTIRIVNMYPHDTRAYTQGLIVHEGFFYESTGIKGRSMLRKVDIATGATLSSVALSSNYFGEGLTVFDNRLIQLTWKNRVAFVYDVADLKLLKQINYPRIITSGWGLTTDGKKLMLSDGSATIYFLDPQTLTHIGSITVTDNGRPILGLNELEYIDGELWANVWKTKYIARISIDTGNVTSWLDLSPLFPHRGRGEFLNGIAYDASSKRLFLTGKWWPRVFEVAVVLSVAERN